MSGLATFRGRLAGAGFLTGFLLASGFAVADPVALGRQVFLEQAEPRCGACHTLADAGTTGQVGPVLDELKPDAGRVKAAVQNGIGVMPAFEDLTPEQVEAVSAYVAAVAGKAR
ncbi:SorU family sulfite dehydrogenase c-type cytochrome subunit [Methylobacterium oxalidis]|uniref:SorU family sulfite dehydrogenase c-type cytochrome subunit n=1 Tax=Methylobacterium oxalidis TaxID=944322 RepID=UPI00331506EB